MIKFFINAWDADKDELEEYFKTTVQKEYCYDYSDILRQVINIVFNNYNDKVKFRYDNIKVIDYGDYQGTLILTFCKDTYQPSGNETYFTIVSYGSCSGCDTLLSIYECGADKLPNEEQVKDYMSLALHLVQNIKCFGNEEEEEE